MAPRKRRVLPASSAKNNIARAQSPPSEQTEEPTDRLSSSDVIIGSSEAVTKISNKPPSTTEKPHLLTLPLEIRHMIYHAYLECRNAEYDPKEASTKSKTKSALRNPWSTRNCKGGSSLWAPFEIREHRVPQKFVIWPDFAHMQQKYMTNLIPALWQLCRQVRNEARTLQMSQQIHLEMDSLEDETFGFESTTLQFGDWAASLGEEVAHIRRIYLSMNYEFIRNDALDIVQKEKRDHRALRDLAPACPIMRIDVNKELSELRLVSFGQLVNHVVLIQEEFKEWIRGLDYGHTINGLDIMKIVSLLLKVRGEAGGGRLAWTVSLLASRYHRRCGDRTTICLRHSCLAARKHRRNLQPHYRMCASATSG